MDDDNPTGPEELEPERLTAVLRDAGHDVTVSSVRAAPIGTGQMAGSYRVHLAYGGDPADLPTTMVAKVPFGPPERRALSANAYRLEVDFYRSIAPRLTARIPRCFAAERDDTGVEFVLLLEDLAPWAPGDQIAGCDPRRAAVAVENLAGVHAPLWGAPDIDELVEPLGTDAIEGTDLVFGMLTETFLGTYGDRLSESCRTMCETFAPRAGAFLRDQRIADGIVHGDYRLDNLLFAPDGSEVAIVDWQTVGQGLPGRDLAFFVATSLTSRDRRATEAELIRTYHDALCGSGVSGYDLTTCEADYAYGLFQIPLTVVFGSAIAASTERGIDMFVAMIERATEAMADHHTLDR
ncbi:MAG: phosphotransferase [Actinobacteria bacterium]|nr:phosphotransferase [Actinomycetota bacterium]